MTNLSTCYLRAVSSPTDENLPKKLDSSIRREFNLLPMSDARISFGDVAIGARFLWKLPSFLRHPITLEEAKATLRHRLENREADFLFLAKHAIFQNPGSPYRQLLKLAGCEYGDLEKLARQDGVEGALKRLFRHGVYLTVDEFKGRQPIARGNTTIGLEPGQLRNPLSAVHVQTRSGASRSRGTPIILDLEDIRNNSVNTGLVLNARGGFGWAHADWAVPGGAIMFELLGSSTFGISKVRWFSQIDMAEPSIHPRYRWSARFMRWGSLLAGVPIPRPEHVPLDDPSPIIHWMEGTLQNGGTPHLRTSSSSAVRLCLFALRNGISLSSVHFTTGAEPITSSRLEIVRRTGAQPFPHYGSQDCGPIAQGCLTPKYSDDLHLFHDLHALIQPDRDADVRALPSNGLLMSSLRPRSRLILLNVSLGDQAIVEQRQCGCSLEQLGWTTHIHTIRSYEKLTALGMTFLDRDIIRVLEEVLPRRFGGAPTDYQLLEEEDKDGNPRLKLLVDPSVISLDQNEVRDAFLDAIGAGSGAERVMGLLWRDARILTVERRHPLTTPAGKILHLHVARTKGDA